MLTVVRDTVLLRGLVDAWTVVTSGRDSDAAATAVRENKFGLAWPMWNLTLGDESHTTGKRQHDCFAPKWPRVESFLAVEHDEYFTLYRILSACDCSIIRSDSPFYLNLFSSLYKHGCIVW